MWCPELKHAHSLLPKVSTTRSIENHAWVPFSAASAIYSSWKISKHRSAAGEDDICRQPLHQHELLESYTSSNPFQKSPKAG